MTGLRNTFDGLPDAPALLLGPSSGADRALWGGGAELDGWREA